MAGFLQKFTDSYKSFSEHRQIHPLHLHFVLVDSAYDRFGFPAQPQTAEFHSVSPVAGAVAATTTTAVTTTAAPAADVAETFAPVVELNWTWPSLSTASTFSLVSGPVEWPVFGTPLPLPRPAYSPITISSDSPVRRGTADSPITISSASSTNAAGPSSSNGRKRRAADSHPSTPTYVKRARMAATADLYANDFLAEEALLPGVGVAIMRKVAEKLRIPGAWIEGYEAEVMGRHA